MPCELSAAVVLRTLGGVISIPWLSYVGILGDEMEMAAKPFNKS